MDLKERLWNNFGMEMMGGIQALGDYEWSSEQHFNDLVDILFADVYAEALSSEWFADYSPAEIQAAIVEAIDEYIDIKYYEANGN